MLYSPAALPTCVGVCVHVCAQSLSRIWLFAILWAVACQDPLFMGFSQQEYWGGLPFPTPALPISFSNLTKTYLTQKFARYNRLKYQWLRLWLFGELYLISSGTNYPDLHPYSWNYLFISKFLVQVTKDFPHILVTMIGTGEGLSGLQAFCHLFDNLNNENKGNIYLKGLLKGLIDWFL